MVIFDCDGVLVDTETLSAQVLSEALAPLGVQLSVAEVFARFRGKSIAACGELVTELAEAARPGRWHTPAERIAFGEAFWQQVQTATLHAFARGVAPVPGIEAVLDHLERRGVPFVVASNGTHEKMHASLTRAGLIERLPRRFSATEVAEGKPAPDLFLYAASQMGVAAGDCTVIEDSPSGARAARAAGIALIGYCPPVAGASDRTAQAAMAAQGARVIERMDELLELL